MTTVTIVMLVFIAMIAAVFIYLIVEMFISAKLLVLLVFVITVYFRVVLVTKLLVFSFACFYSNLQNLPNHLYHQQVNSKYEDALYREDCFEFQVPP